MPPIHILPLIITIITTITTILSTLTISNVRWTGSRIPTPSD